MDPAMLRLEDFHRQAVHLEGLANRRDASEVRQQVAPERLESLVVDGEARQMGAKQFLVSPQDLCGLADIPKLAKIGIESFKIEGRTKSPYYVSRTVQAYRSAIDDAVNGRPFNTALLGNLEGLANRGYTDGFYERHHDKEYQLYMRGHSLSGRSL